MSEFGHTTAKIAAWNLAGFGDIPNERLVRQVEGLALLDAEVVALVEINPLDALQTLQDGLAGNDVTYNHSILTQENDLHIGVLFKEGITAKNPRLLDGSDLADTRRRKALVVEIKVGRFDFILIAVHLKSGRGAAEQQIHDEQSKIIGQFITEHRKQSRVDFSWSATSTWSQAKM